MSNSPGWYRVQFLKAQITGRITWLSMEILQDVDKHDVCIVKFTSYQKSYEGVIEPGTPVNIEYGANRSAATFIGNVAKISPSKKLEGVYHHQITIAAASRQLRVTSRNTWRNKTAPEVVRDLGKKLGFKVVTKQHSLRKKTITQTGGSYWEFLTGLAKMCGYVLRVQGTTIYFLPLADMVRAYRSGAPVLAYGHTGDDTTRIFEFTASVGNTSDDPEDLADAATVTAFGPDDKAAADITEYPGSAVRRRKKYISTYERSNPTIVAYTRQEARALARGMADRGQMAFDAQLESAGDPGLAPFRPVYINSGSPMTTGWWIVKSVRHTFSNGEYQCESVVSTDEVSRETSPAPRSVPFRDVYAETVYETNIDGSLLYVPEPNVIYGDTFSPNSSYSTWVSSSPGPSLAANTGLLTTTEPVVPGGTYPSEVTFPQLSLYPSA